MYDKDMILEIQTRSNQVYEIIIKNGYTHLEAIDEILSHGIKYNDIMSGILTKGIEG